MNMNKQENQIAGIGGQTGSPLVALNREETDSLIEAWCTHPELYQDIRNELLRQFNEKSGFFRFQVFAAQVRVFDNHRVASIQVLRGYSEGTMLRLYSIQCTPIYVSLSPEGFITDIVEKPKSMNPSNGRYVGAMSKLKAA
jgi:hypothetical protein